MRGIIALSLVAFFCPAVAMAQGAAVPSANPAAGEPPPANAPAEPGMRRGGRDLTRAEFIERAKRSAERRFDRMDTNHDGVVTMEERRAFRAKRRGAEPQ